MSADRVTVQADRGFLAEVLHTLRIDFSLALFGLLANSIAGSALVPRLFRIPLLRLAGIRVGRAHVWPNVRFITGNVRLGDRVTINRECLFDSIGGITIGDRVHVGFQVTFITTGHEVGDHGHRCGVAYSEPIVVDEGAWIGARATILSGVRVGAGCVIAAGSLVRDDCEPDGLYAGVPARRIRDL